MSQSMTRSELYRALWSKTRKALAEEWELPASIITEVAKSADIPLPPPGYWTLVELGKDFTISLLEGNIQEVITQPPALFQRPKVAYTNTSEKQSAHECCNH
ncbi:hypothetical protein GCM10023116_05810 [Kistimonas scapharcae]|uniref:Uncharacterized protein n=1 Tax=Kistimonas scapharcae TaxID=1036133 RepID=A0ABP8UYU0_9GAMM